MWFGVFLEKVEGFLAWVLGLIELGLMVFEEGTFLKVLASYLVIIIGFSVNI